MTENTHYILETVFMFTGAAWFILQLAREILGAVGRKK